MVLFKLCIVTVTKINDLNLILGGHFIFGLQNPLLARRTAARTLGI